MSWFKLFTNVHAPTDEESWVWCQVGVPEAIANMVLVPLDNGAFIVQSQDADVRQ